MLHIYTHRKSSCRNIWLILGYFIQLWTFIYSSFIFLNHTYINFIFVSIPDLLRFLDHSSSGYVSFFYFYSLNMQILKKQLVNQLFDHDIVLIDFVLKIFSNIFHLQLVKEGSSWRVFEIIRFYRCAINFAGDNKIIFIHIHKAEVMQPMSKKNPTVAFPQPRKPGFISFHSVFPTNLNIYCFNTCCSSAFPSLQ